MVQCAKLLQKSGAFSSIPPSCAKETVCLIQDTHAIWGHVRSKHAAFTAKSWARRFKCVRHLLGVACRRTSDARRAMRLHEQTAKQLLLGSTRFFLMPCMAC